MRVLALKQLIDRSFGNTRRRIIHLTFWTILLLALIAIDYNQVGWPLVFYQKFVDVIFYMAIIYINLLYLIPKYLSATRFWMYVALLMLAVIVLTPIKIAIQVLLFADTPSFQNYFIENQSYFFISMFMVGSSSTIYGILSDWFIHQSERIELQTQTMQSELKFLRSQINPHFLFNTLNNLYALTLKKSDDAPAIVLKLSEMMRYMLYECNEKKVLLSKEVSYMQNYLDLERLRQRASIEITFELDGEVNDQKIAPLLLIPFIENSFKHGLTSRIDGWVRIRLQISQKKLLFDIENSKGPGMPKQVHRKSGGIGLVNVRRRLNLIYPDNYQLKISNEPNSYRVSLDLNL